MRALRIAVFAALSLGAFADSRVTVNSVVATVRSGIARKRKDGDIADALEKVQLVEQLNDRVMEILESEGAGPQTMGELQHLRDVSSLLPPPADPPPGMTPPAPPTLDEMREIWDGTASQAIHYTESLPNFLCTETVHRWIDSTGKDQWAPSPTVVADLSFSEQKEQYKLVSVDGKPSKQNLMAVGGAISQGEFGTLLANIFNPASETEFRWDHWTILRKRPTHVYFFRIGVSHRPEELHFAVKENESVAATVGQHGFVYIDRDTRQVTRISASAEGIPADFPVKKSDAVLDYDYAEIGDAKFLLPLRAEIRLDAASVRNLNSVEFQKYRKFSAAATVNFEDSGQAVKK